MNYSIFLIQISLRKNRSEELSLLLDITKIIHTMARNKQKHTHGESSWVFYTQQTPYDAQVGMVVVLSLKNMFFGICHATLIKIYF